MNNGFVPPIDDDRLSTLASSSLVAPVLVAVISDFAIEEWVVQDFLYGCRGEGVAGLRLVAAVV
ncbi:hypothetical protein D1872_300040 [compost metagenome]